MFLKQDKSEIDDFEGRKKTLVLKEKYFEKENILKKVLTDTLAKLTKYFCIFFCFRTF